MKTLVILLLSVNSWAFNKAGHRTIVATDKAVKTAAREGYGIGIQEREIKSELLRLKKKSPKSFDEKLSDKLGNPAYYQSYIYEIRDGLASIEKAKVLAKQTLAEAVQQNWPELQKSFMNKNSDVDWKGFSHDFKRNLNKDITYQPSKKAGSKKDFVFEAGDWGRVIVASNMKTAKWSLDVASYLDGNRLEDGAEKIQIQEDNSSPKFNEEPVEEQPQAPVQAPVLAKQERKGVVPQLKRSLNKKSTNFD